MKVKEAAKLLGVSPLTIRVGLQQGVFPFGTAFKRKESNKNYTYVLFPELVRQYAGTRNAEEVNDEERISN